MVRGARGKTASPPPEPAAPAPAPAKRTRTRASRRLNQGEGTGKSSPLASLTTPPPRARGRKAAPKKTSKASGKTKPDTTKEADREEVNDNVLQSQSPPPSTNASEAGESQAATEEITDDDEHTLHPETSAEMQLQQEIVEHTASPSPSVQLESEIPSETVVIVDLESTPTPSDNHLDQPRHSRSPSPSHSLPDYESDHEQVETPRPSTENRLELAALETGAGDIYTRRSPSLQENEADADTCKDNLFSPATVQSSPDDSTACDAQLLDQLALAVPTVSTPSCDQSQNSDATFDAAFDDTTSDCAISVNDSLMQQIDNSNDKNQCYQKSLQSHPMLKMIDRANGLPEIIFDARYTDRFIDAFATLSNADQLYIVSLLYTNGVHRTNQLYDTHSKLSQTQAALDASRQELEVKGFDVEDKEMTVFNQERRIRQADERIEHLKRALFEARMGRGLATNVNEEDDDDQDTTNDLEDTSTSLRSPRTQTQSRKRPAPDDEPDQDLDQRQHRRLRFSTHVARSSPHPSKFATFPAGTSQQRAALQGRAQSLAAELSDSDSSEKNDNDETYMTALKTLNSSRERSNRLRLFSPATEERIEKRRRNRARTNKPPRSSLSTPRPTERIPDTLTPPETPIPQPQSASSWGFRSLLGSVTRFIPGLRGAHDPQTEPIRRTRHQITSQADVDRIFSHPADSPQSAEPGSPATPTPAGRRAPVVSQNDGDTSTDVFITPPDRNNNSMSGALSAGARSADRSRSSSPELALGTQSVDRNRSHGRRPRPKRNADARARVIATGKARAETRAAATEASKKEYQEMWAEAQRRVREVEDEERVEREQANRKRKRVAIDQLKSIPHGPPGQTGTFGLLPAFFDHGSDSEESVSADESDIRMEDASPLPPSKRVRFSASDHVSRFNNDSPPASRSQGQHFATANGIVDNDPHRARPYAGTLFAEPISRSQTSPANNAAPYEGAMFAGQDDLDEASGNVFDKMHNKSADKQDGGFNKSGHFELSYDDDTESEASMLSEAGPPSQSEFSPPQNVATVEDDDGNVISHAYSQTANGNAAPSSQASADNVALNPPAKPTPAHATLPGSPAPGGSDALARARSQAEKYKPKQPSGLRASSGLSNSTVASELGNNPDVAPPPADGTPTTESNIFQTNGLNSSQPKFTGFSAVNGSATTEAPQKTADQKTAVNDSPLKQTPPQVNGIIKENPTVNGITQPVATDLTAPELAEVMRLVNSIPDIQLQLHDYTFPVGEPIVCDDPVVEAAVQAAMKHPDFEARAERMFAAAMAETAAWTKEEERSFMDSIGVL